MAIFVQEVGAVEAPTVVLLHGVGTSGWMWTKQVSALADDMHVLVPDLPGHGRSNTQPWISIADTARLVAEAIAARAPEGRAYVVGLSLGGYVAAHLAATAPEALSGAILSGVNVLPFPNPGRLRLMGTLMAPVMKWGPVLRANARALNVPAEDVDGYQSAARATSRQAFRRVSDEALGFRLASKAADSPCPVLAVAGANEHDLTRRSLVDIAAAFPNGEACLAPGVGHAWSGEKPGLFTAMIRARVTGGRLPEELIPVR
ncbi:alpha/beta fold hydrolase [Nonomuraea sp. K274]|uniref:Alpha/beta fold hydrolase n=1 Tax=Nonomuraea cypriaca TaxID=1187855 RepID=A0A931EV45_9ACTN|nr:alpha/beta fold hydrolase [Nonomuraea cypriaca]MBF8185254.1 alpha/beta fold hydrolase [Nonomuraea cypriaca]